MSPAGAAPAEPGALSFRQAEQADAAAIVSLVNSAYRGEASRAGWTTEADFLDGQRTDLEQVSSLLAAPNSLFLLCYANDGAGGALIASAHLEHGAEGVHFGMFAVKPGLQNRGIGKRFLQTAETLAGSRWGAQKMLMTVITRRLSLIAFYERRGYRRTGRIQRFPRSHKFGIPRVPGLQLEVLEKTLGK